MWPLPAVPLQGFGHPANPARSSAAQTTPHWTTGALVLLMSRPQVGGYRQPGRGGTAGACSPGPAHPPPCQTPAGAPESAGRAAPPEARTLPRRKPGRRSGGGPDPAPRPWRRQRDPRDSPQEAPVPRRASASRRWVPPTASGARAARGPRQRWRPPPACTSSPPAQHATRLWQPVSAATCRCPRSDHQQRKQGGLRLHSRQPRSPLPVAALLVGEVDPPEHQSLHVQGEAV
mmetsp:Transcript_97698/g.276401  ORF Transcript_97698/g.276401 Transcript_97698/m.276401 type:complete len:232 (+) Transcript_97698:1212-1907(+)